MRFQTSEKYIIDFSSELKLEIQHNIGYREGLENQFINSLFCTEMCILVLGSLVWGLEFRVDFGLPNSHQIVYLIKEKDSNHLLNLYVLSVCVCVGGR